jgi:RNA polymerase primary sigma factor
LYNRIHAGDMGARNELVQANLRFVIGVAITYQNRGLTLPELISAGNLGLITAAERFDGTRGCKFITYAVWWIRQSIKQTINEHGRMIRLPVQQLDLLHKISEASRRLEQRRRGDLEVEEMATKIGAPIKMVREVLLSARVVGSLDEPFDESSERNLLNILADPDQEAPDADVLRKSAEALLEKALSSLNEREARIVRLYFGLGNDEPLTLEQIGSLLHLTRERVRQLKERALNKLRHPHFGLMQEREVI